MERILRICAFLLIVLLFSCEDQTFIIKCSDCTTDEPTEAEINAKLDSRHFYNALIQVYEGNIEDSILIATYTSTSSTFTEWVKLNKKYTITATYYVADDVYTAVDSATPRVKYDKSQCDNPCYYLYDFRCDLRLKYTR